MNHTPPKSVLRRHGFHANWHCILKPSLLLVYILCLFIARHFSSVLRSCKACQTCMVILITSFLNVEKKSGWKTEKPNYKCAIWSLMGRQCIGNTMFHSTDYFALATLQLFQSTGGLYQYPFLCSQ